MINKKVIALTISLALVASAAINTNVIAGTITDIIKTYTSAYKEIPIKNDVSKTKNFEIKFNREISFISVNSNTIKVVNSKGTEIPVKLTQKSTDKTVVIVEAPTGGYTEGETYALIIRKGISSLNSFKLVDETVMKFVIAASGSTGGSTGGTTTPTTTGTNRVVSVDYKGNNIKNNNSFDTNKIYSAIANDNLLSKDKLLVNMSLFGLQRYTYNVIADYQKSKAAFEKIDILDPIVVKEEDLATNNITINFGTDIDSSSVVSGSTVYCEQVEGGLENLGFANPMGRREVEIASKTTNSLVLSIKDTGNGLVSNYVNYLFLNGIKDNNGKSVKSMIIPIYISYTNNRDTISADEILKSKPGDVTWDWNTGIIGINCTSLKIETEHLLDWDRISRTVSNSFSSYEDLLKEVRNRMPIYEIMAQDMYNTGIFPKNGLKVGTTQYYNKGYIWDRFIYNGKQVDVSFERRYVYINIYDKGYKWMENPNYLDRAFGIPYNAKHEIPANWQYNFNKTTMYNWTYK